MLLTITYRGKNPEDLGYLLHKNPNRVQYVELTYGRACIYYPKLSEDIATCAMLLDINPVDLARGKVGSEGGGLFDYVNDRPYAASSFMSNAISRAFGTAMSGRSKERQELADMALNLEAFISMLPCRTDISYIDKVFGPLGYETQVEEFLLDDQNPSWGRSPYINLTIRGKVRLRDMLNHLYILIPVFDRQKHYWISRDEVDKLLYHAKEWLKDHPEMRFITGRYLERKTSLVKWAYSEMLDGAEEPVSYEVRTVEPADSLNTLRLRAVLEAALKSGASSVIDMGCGEGNLLRLLVRENQFSRIGGTDVSCRCLETAASRLKLNERPHLKDKVALFQSSLTYRDKRFAGYDAAVVVEVIEHLEPERLEAFVRAVFEYAKPYTVIITTPNRDYNVNYPGILAGRLRHPDHRFELTKAEFEKFVRDIESKFGYEAVISGIGEPDAQHGCPTQMGVFTLCV